jgi:hypothetical protein
MVKVSKFCQPSAPSLLTSSSLVSNQLNRSWIPRHELWLSTTLAWFTPLLEGRSPLLNDFETFFEDFNAMFGDSNKEHMFTTKLQYISQGSCLAIVYVSNFKQLVFDISWDETTLISHFNLGYTVM